MLFRSRIIFAGGFQLNAGAVLTNYLSSGAALFTFLSVPVILPLVIVLLFKVVATNIVRLYVSKVVKEA